ncbi:MAG: hydrogenase maturation protease [Saprospiraceae bacterium]
METARALKTAILGFGNPVRSDDAIGVYVVNELQKQIGSRDDISIFDMGTSAFEILFKLKEHHQLVIIDSVINSGEPDGTLFSLPAAEIHAQIIDDPMLFLHGMKWDQALSYAKKIMGDSFPENEIRVYLIAISETSINMELSDKIREAGNKLIKRIAEEI